MGVQEASRPPPVAPPPVLKADFDAPEADVDFDDGSTEELRS